MNSRIADALRAVLPSDAVLTDAEVLEEYAHDDAEWEPYEPPAAVVFALTLDDVVETMRVCHRLNVPVIPRGGGSGLSGGANATTGSVALSLDKMTRIVEVNADSVTPLSWRASSTRTCASTWRRTGSGTRRTQRA